jgi:Lon protease-like protein
MSNKKITETEKEVFHPLEEIFDIEESTTVVPYKEVKTDLVPHEPYDPKDGEIEEQFQELYDMALEAFENQQEESDVIDPKYRARNAEVAVQYLKTALEAAREKRQLKEHKDKIVTKQTTGNTVNNNLITSHTDLLDAISDAIEKKDAVEGEFEEK